MRAGLVTDPVQYQWSSYAAKVVGNRDPVVDDHLFYLSLGENKQDRQKAYAEYALGTVPECEIKLIRDALQRGQLTGSERFRVRTEKSSVSASLK
ncbi:MAG: hypothetical protein GY799_11230 [Desulfobulbaceae bacterium]|nr:hypothetical protein [Desulfobulbaceae bacterium]